jgi:hypothetical protein
VLLVGRRRGQRRKKRWRRGRGEGKGRRRSLAHENREARLSCSDGGVPRASKGRDSFGPDARTVSKSVKGGTASAVLGQMSKNVKGRDGWPDARTGVQKSVKGGQLRPDARTGVKKKRASREGQLRPRARTGVKRASREGTTSARCGRCQTSKGGTASADAQTVSRASRRQLQPILSMMSKRQS